MKLNIGARYIYVDLVHKYVDTIKIVRTERIVLTDSFGIRITVSKEDIKKEYSFKYGIYCEEKPEMDSELYQEVGFCGGFLLPLDKEKAIRGLRLGLKKTMEDLIPSEENKKFTLETPSTLLKLTSKLFITNYKKAINDIKNMKL